MNAALDFVAELDDLSAGMSTVQAASIRAMWCLAADALASAPEWAIPLLSEDSAGLWVVCWAYPGERLTCEVNHRGWVQWSHVTLTGERRPVWGVITTGAGIPDTRIPAFVRRRANALGF